MTVLNTLNFNLNYFVSNLKKRKLSYNNMKISTKKIYSTDFINSIILKYYRHQRCDFHSVTEWRREASRALAVLGSLRRGSVPVSAMMSWGGLVGSPLVSMKSVRMLGSRAGEQLAVGLLA